jgi:flagellar biosynthetic protein FlhB
MADDQDQSQKTEDPTQKRLTDAREKGQVASSREVNHWFMILAATLVVMVFMPGAMVDIKGLLTVFMEQPHAIGADAGNLRGLMATVLGKLLLALLPTLLLLVAAAVAAGLVQNGLIVSTEPLKPKLEKISIGKGLKRLFSAKSLVEFAKGVFKLTIVGAVATGILWPEVASLGHLASVEVLGGWDYMWLLAVKLLIGVLAIMSLIAGLDFLFQKFQHVTQMRMSRQDIRDEMKQTEGDPHIRARLRQIRRERAQKRMMQAVPRASVVIVNPTHFAVALKYELDDMNAPMVLAKGVDSLALKIREIAEANDVPVMENPPLARALYASAEIGDEIPAEHYKAVAEIIGYVMRLKGKLPGRPVKPKTAG